MFAGKLIHRQRKKRSKLFRDRTIAGYVCALPWIMGFLIFTLGPIGISIIMSFTEYNVLNPPKFIGGQNYVKLLTGDPLFWKSLYNTFYITVFGVPFSIVVGLLIALLLNIKIKGITTFRTIFYLPAIVPIVASSLLWMWMYNPRFGLINFLLSHVGIQCPNWLSNKTWAKPAIIFMGLWGAGAGMIIYLAGLQGIPKQLYEAAIIDGANWYRKFTNITIPMLTPTIFFNMVMSVIAHFQVFTQAYIMTQGGPADSTLFYVYYLFNQAFRYFNMGYASALAWILFIIILIATLVQFRLASKWVYYTGE